MMKHASFVAPFAFVVVFACAVAPLFARAEEEGDVRAAVVTELLRDPRTANIPPAQLSAIIDALSGEAKKRAISAADILWHPAEFSKAPGAARAAAEYFGRCDQAYVTLCPFNVAFGFSGAASNVPAWLFILSALLSLLLPRFRKDIEKRHAALSESLV